MRHQRAGNAGPLKLYEEGFREHLEGVGYLPESVRWRLRQLATLNRWLRDHGLTADELDDSCVERLVRERRAQGLATFVSVRNFAVPLAYLRGIGAVPSQVSLPSDPVSRTLEQYRGYLVTERGLGASSISDAMRITEGFCSTLDHSLEELTAAEITAYLVALCGRSSVGWSKKTVSALASFLRFLHIIGVTAQPLMSALPKVAGHRHKVPCELEEVDFRRLLGGCDCSRDVGLRDSAILTVLWRLGLRRGEVAGLRVDDIDWRDGEITIRGKGHRHDVLPLPQDVGEAIVRYLQDSHRRVPPGCRALFVQMRAPEGPMSPAGVGDVVTRLCKRVGLPAWGAHQLRHGTATQLVRHGASWPEIAQVMRHRNMAVTVSYATVDSVLMRELARPWPGA